MARSIYDLSDLDEREYKCYRDGLMDGRFTREFRYTESRQPDDYTDREGWAYNVGHMDGQDGVMADPPPGLSVFSTGDDGGSLR